MKILFLHGLGQTKDAWNQTIQAVRGKSTECIELFVPNAKNQTFYTMADRLEQKLIKEKEPIVLCGLSLGAVLALELYFRQPEKIKGLILIAPQYRMPTKIIDIQNIIFRLMPNKLFAKMRITKREMISVTSSMRQIDYRDKIKRINLPVYIVCGSKDRANKKAAVSLNNLLPLSKLFMINDAGHEVNIDKPKELARIINEAFIFKGVN